MLRVLLTGGGGAGNEALQRLLGGRYEMHFADADPEAFDPAIEPSRCHTVPLATASDFVDGVQALCRRLAIDVLVPGVDEELRPLSRAADRLAPTRVMLPAPAYIETMLDKLACMRLLSASGIAVPRTGSLGNQAGLPFPCFAKPRCGRGSRYARRVNSRAEAEALALLCGEAEHGLLLQELLVGQEYTVAMAADGAGNLAAVVPVKVDLKRGITLRAQTEAAPAVVEACRAIHAAVPACGCYNIQLMLLPDGTVRPFEINPRVSTTLCMAVAIGIDPIDIFLGRSGCSDLLPFCSGVRLRRHWHNHLTSASS